MRLEAGKSYRCRNGMRATVDRVYDGYTISYEAVAVGKVETQWPVYLWRADGTKLADTCQFVQQEHYDIVAEWTDRHRQVPLTATVHADGQVDLDSTPLNKAAKALFGLCRIDCDECAK